MDGEDRTGRERKERLRARRDEAGMAQVSGWVPKDRRPYAREVLAALARGANSLPPDPEQAAALDVAQADATAAKAAEAEARVKRHQELDSSDVENWTVVSNCLAARVCAASFEFSTEMTTRRG